jgi:hypothetical protein
MNDLLVVEDHPNTCPHDGTRTEFLSHHKGEADKGEAESGYSVELCPTCKKIFHFWNE